MDANHQAQGGGSPESAGPSKALKVLGAVLPPGTVVALLFFFGYSYSQSFYGQFGLSVDALGLTTSDFLVRSSHVLIPAVRILSLALVAAVAVHVSLRWASGLPTHPTSFARVIGVVLLCAGLFLMAFSLWGDFGAFTVSTLWLAGSLAACYGVWWAWVAGRQTGELGAAGQRIGSRDRAVVSGILLLAGFGLVAYGAFEVTRVSARQTGIARAEYVQDHCAEYPRIRVYSTVRLGLSWPGVEEQSLPWEAGDFRIRYDGVRLLNQRNGMYLVWPADRSPLDGVSVLPEDDRLRIEPVLDQPTGACPLSSQPGSPAQASRG